jgi:hypothetical protein
MYPWRICKMVGISGSIGDDSEPMELQKHAPLQIDNVDMRINVLKEYISKVPDAALKDLKKVLIGYSKYTDNELRDLIKSASDKKYKEIYNNRKRPKSHIMPKEIIYLPKVNLISDEVIPCGFPYKKEELQFIQTHSNLLPRHIYTIYKIAFPQSQRNQQFITDCRHLTKMNPEKYLIKDLQSPKQSPVKHTIETSVTNESSVINSHVLAQAITALYKSGKSPALFSQIKPVIELIEDPNEVAFAIECLTS